MKLVKKGLMLRAFAVIWLTALSIGGRGLELRKKSMWNTRKQVSITALSKSSLNLS